MKEQEQGQESGDDGGDAFVNAAWEANIFSRTYQVNAMGLSGFCETEELLDNQADLSICTLGCYVNYAC